MGSLVALVLLGLIIAIIVKWIRDAQRFMVCTRCEITDHPRYVTRGSFAVELILWILFIVPGLIYTLWRISARRIATCKHCGAQAMVPLNSPAGQRIVG